MRGRQPVGHPVAPCSNSRMSPRSQVVREGTPEAGLTSEDYFLVNVVRPVPEQVR